MELTNFSLHLMGFQGITFEIFLRLGCSVVQKHHTRMRYLLNSGYLRLVQFKDSFQNQS